MEREKRGNKIKYCRKERGERAKEQDKRGERRREGWQKREIRAKRIRLEITPRLSTGNFVCLFVCWFKVHYHLHKTQHSVKACKQGKIGKTVQVTSSMQC